VLEGRELDANFGQSLSQTIESVPGVSTFARGPMNGKPVVRGLTAQRVTVAENGQRHESQGWDDEQSPEIDIFDAEQIEIVRGPHSVLFGSDALGGVVNVITRPFDEGAGRLNGLLVFNGFTVDQQAAGHVSLFGSSSDVRYRGSFTARTVGDIGTPEGTLPNSGAKETNGRGTLGLDKEWGNLSLDYSHFDQTFKISPDPDEDPDATPFQKILHDQAQLLYGTGLSFGRLEVNGNWQLSTRSEFEEGEEEDADTAMPAVKLRLHTAGGEVKLHHHPIGSMFGTIGGSISRQSNETLGEEPLIPGFTDVNGSFFVYEEFGLSDVNVSVGARYDNRKLDVDENDDIGVEAQTRTYDAFTGSVGVVFHATDRLSFASNLGKGWRAPIAEELFVNGVDEGAVRFKVGDSTLAPEESINIDASIRYNDPKVKAELSLFHNRINKYIFLSPSGEVDSASGFEKSFHHQANATIMGIEYSLESALTDNFIVQASGNFLNGRNDETDTWLPMIPANRIIFGIRLTEPSLLMWRSPYFSVKAKVTFDQNHLAEDEDPTGGYSLFDLGFGGMMNAGGHAIKFDFAVLNLLNKAYFDHLSRYKDYGLNPGVGVSAKVTVPFTVAE